MIDIKKLAFSRAYWLCLLLSTLTIAITSFVTLVTILLSRIAAFLRVGMGYTVSVIDEFLSKTTHVFSLIHIIAEIVIPPFLILIMYLLLKIEGIDKNLAKKLYAKGIEDLGVLAMATDDELQIEDFDIQKMKELQQEARRIINALTTHSVRFRKGIDKKTYNLLAKKGVYLIKQVTEMTETPEGIDSLVWKKIVEDARRIMGNHDVEKQNSEYENRKAT